MWVHIFLWKHWTATSCWTTMDRRMQEPTKKISKAREKPQDGRRDATMIKSNPIPTGGQHTSWRTSTLQRFSHCVKVPNPTSGFPIWGSHKGIWQSQSPGNLTLKASGIWLQDFHRTGGNRLHSWRTQTKSCAHQGTGKGAESPPETEPDLPASVGGSPGEGWAGRGSQRGQGHWPQQAWECSLA